MDKRKAMGALRAKQGKALLGDFILEDIHDYRVDRHSFTVYLGGDPSHPGPEKVDPMELGEPGVEFMMADRFELNMGLLSSIDPNRPILVNQSSCGGYWDDGMKIFSTILYSPNPVTVLATKWARSMTSLIPLAADRFLIRPPTPYMFHFGEAAYHGIFQEYKTNFMEQEKANDMMLRIYTARLREHGRYSKWSESRIRAMLENKVKNHIDVWLSSDESVQWGLADAVFDGNYENLRATKKNLARRKRMVEVLRKPVNVEIRIS